MNVPWASTTAQLPLEKQVPCVNILRHSSSLRRFQTTTRQHSDPRGWYHCDDWNRVSYVAEVLRPGSDFFDVGVGAGQFVNILAPSGGFRFVVGVDTHFTKYTELMSLPFWEPEPISKTHVRRFEAADIRELSPDATFTLLDRPQKPWMLIEERFDGTTPAAVGEASMQPESVTGSGDARDATIARLRAEVESLKNRKVVRFADLLGHVARRLRRWLRR